MSEVADYIMEKYHVYLLTGKCRICGEWWTEIDGERVVGCEHFPVEEKRGKCRENKEKIEK